MYSLSFSVSLFLSSPFSFLFIFPPFALPIRFFLYNDQIKYYAGKISKETPRIFRSVLDALPRPISTTCTVYRHGRRRREVEYIKGKRKGIFDIANGSRIKKHFFERNDFVLYNLILSFQLSFLKIHLLILITSSCVMWRSLHIERRVHSLKSCIRLYTCVTYVQI